MKKTRIIANKIRCKQCGDVIESKTTHDFKWCSCRKVGVDGGKDYMRRIGNYERDIEELSICEPEEEEEYIFDEEE